MLKRLLANRVKVLLKKYPAVALLGPRQSGKTTLSKMLGGIYYDLEQEVDRLRLDIEWEKVVESKNLVVLDEAQTYPEIFRRLRGAIDIDRRRNNRFLILGSVSPSLLQNVPEMLTGRLAICELTPFIILELPKELKDHWLMGGYPDGGILRSAQFPEWQRHYLDLLIQRDLPNWGLPSKPQLTLKLLRMLAASHGNVWNASQISGSLGISYHTVNTYLNYLEGVFLIRRLEPFYGNVRKRLIKSPKIFLRDSGLLHSLMGVQSYNDLLARPWVGSSWKGYVIEQIISYLNVLGKSFESFYLRTSDGYELDLLLNMSGKRLAFEIKLTSSPDPQDIEHLVKTSKLIDSDQAVLISQTANTIRSKSVISTNLEGILKVLKGI